MPDDQESYSEPLNPVQVETAINSIRVNIAKGVRIVSDAEKESRTRTRKAARAYAFAYLAAPGPQAEKRYRAETDPDVIAAQDAADVAELAFNESRRIAEGLRDELSAYQAINKSLISMYGSERGVGP